MRKISKEIVNERLLDSNRGIKLIGDYTSSRDTTKFECVCGHCWMATPNNILNGKGCPKCSTTIGSNKLRSSKEEVNILLKDRGICMIGEYTTALSKSLFKCNCGNEWEATPGNIISGRQCPVCSMNSRRSSKEIVNRKLFELGRTDRMIGEFTTFGEKSDFECVKGHRWRVSPHHAIGGNGCPNCAKHGFNIEKSGYSYVLEYENFIKYGITNNLENRLKDHIRNIGPHLSVASKLYEKGIDALNWEKNIKTIFGGKFATKEIAPKGWTETLPKNKLESLLKTIRDTNEL